MYKPHTVYTNKLLILPTFEITMGLLLSWPPLTENPQGRPPVIFIISL